MLASLGCLQPGIDPVFLTLLSAADAVRPADHGWIVGATQSGMAIGSVVVWRFARLAPLAYPLAAFCAFLAALATVQAQSLEALLAIRATYGLAMGITYARAMSVAAISRPNGAYGAVFLLQLLLSTLTALALTELLRQAGARPALAALCFVPLLSILLSMPRFARSLPPRLSAAPPAPAREPMQEADAAGWAFAIATLLFISATMMVWSFTGALAIEAGIGEGTVGLAVALGSIVGAVTAAAVMRERTLIPPLATGVLAGLSLLTPIAAAGSGDATAFVIAIVLLNIGSTAIIIRCSGLASARSLTPRFRTFVTCTHSLGMIIGPVIGSLASMAGGRGGLLLAAILTIAAGCGALLLSTLYRSGKPAFPALFRNAQKGRLTNV